MISPMDVSVLDSNSEELGTLTNELMDNAGRALAETIRERYGKARPLFFIGTGNNGGDGLVAARYLVEMGSEPLIILMKDPSMIRTDISRSAHDLLDEKVVTWQWDHLSKSGGFDDLLSGCDLLIDGLLGSGASGTPRGTYKDAVYMINGSKKETISIDIPTGLGTGLSVNADLTVTFHDMKSNMMKDGKNLPECGEIIVKDICIPPDAARLVGKGDLIRIPRKGKDAHKGSGGKLLIVGGGPFTGAPSLAALAAVSSGCDLVRVAVPYGIWEVVAGASLDIIVERMHTKDPYKLGPEIMDRLKDAVGWADTILIGPGSGRDQQTLALLSELFDHCVNSGKKVVVDADAITAIARVSSEWPTIDEDRVIITPHRNEMKRLLDGVGIGSDERYLDNITRPTGGNCSLETLDPLVRFTKMTGADILLKGNMDMIITPHEHSLGEHIFHRSVYIRYNRTGVPEMSVGGTGDLLSGLCSGFSAMGLSSFDSGCISAYVIGKAGEIALSKYGISLSASRVLEMIPEAIQS